MRARFRGRRYEVELRRIGDPQLGYCDSPKAPGKKIVLRADAKLDERWYTAIHEGLHAIWFQMSEETIECAAKDLTKYLRRLLKDGYLR